MISNVGTQQYILPDFLIIGAAKCGTTSMADYLAQHSKVFIPKIKECRFFSGMTPDFKGPGDYVVNQEMITEIGDYVNQFSGQEQKFLGDASVDYLYYYKNTIANIYKYYPKDKLPKLIISLRNPVNRTFSMYAHLKRDLRETLSLPDAIAAEKEREEAHWEWVWQYTAASLYCKQVQYFLEHYDADKIYISIYEDFVKDTEQGMKGIFEFLELDVEYINTEKILNPSGEAKNKTLQRLIVNKGPVVASIKKLIPQGLKDYFVAKNLKSFRITEDDIALLQPIFKEDIAQLEKLLNKELIDWK
ncbi:sulfotransferase family protein [Neptunitalea lumnitzerae]|uniref:Sulfotransferase n=1 Tax=Neptunitalea lumnitzerae TaxID=2965509 RepID=A0ABQ5MFG1_9FLAO|nr:sulfotransferase [Neptunitalea sp. Y10]GLB48137.1 sulfotransferase [Neptunitalea sp. Y10]